MSDIDYVPVHEEPRHRRRFENEYARVYDVLIPPGDQTLYHEHTEDTLYVSILPAEVDDQSYGETTTTSVRVQAGIAICRPHRSEPLIHRVRNVGVSDMRMIGVEAKRTPPDTDQSPPNSASLKKLWGNPRMNCYSVELQTLEQIEFSEPRRIMAGVLIFLQQCSIRSALVTASLEAGTTLWHHGPLPPFIRNEGETGVTIILAQWV